MGKKKELRAQVGDLSHDLRRLNGQLKVVKEALIETERRLTNRESEVRLLRKERDEVTMQLHNAWEKIDFLEREGVKVAEIAAAKTAEVVILREEWVHSHDGHLGAVDA